MIFFSDDDESTLITGDEYREEFYKNLYEGALEQIDEILEQCKNKKQRASLLWKALLYIVAIKERGRSGEGYEYNSEKALLTTKILLKKYQESGGKKFFLCDSCRAVSIDFEIVKFLFEANSWDKEDYNLAIWWANYRAGFEDKGHTEVEAYLKAQKIKR